MTGVGAIGLLSLGLTSNMEKNMKNILCILIFCSLCFTGCVNNTEKNREEIFLKREDAEYNYYITKQSNYYEIYRQNKKSGKKQLLRSERYISALALDDEWIYFADVERNVCKMKKDGKEYSVVINYEYLCDIELEVVQYLLPVSNYIFIRIVGGEFKLYRYDCNSGEMREVYYDARNIDTGDNAIYYSGKEATIYKMDFNSDTSEVVLQSNREDEENPQNLYKNFIIVNNILYYYKRCPDGLYRYENGNSILIDNNSNINEFSLCSYKDKIYYVVRTIDIDTDILMAYDTKLQITFRITELEDYDHNKNSADDKFFYYVNSKGESQKVEIS